MSIDDVIDNLVLDYGHYSEKRRKAILRCNTEYVADLDARMRLTREKLDSVMQVQQYERGRGGEHELVRWGDAGYFPGVEQEPAYRPAWVTDAQEPEYIVPLEPTAADWRRAASRYVETGSKEDYDLMLTMVRLDHPVPNLWAEANIAKTTSKTPEFLPLAELWTTPKSLTLGDLWRGIRWYLLIFAFWAISIVVGINLFT